MTLSTTSNRNDYPGTGSVGPFAFTFKIFAATDLDVVKLNALGAEASLAYLTDYSVAGVGESTGGSITLVTALAVGEKLTIRRIRPLTQDTSIRNQGEFLPEIHEDTFDHFTMVDQQQQEQLERALALPVTVAPDVSATLPTPSASQVLGWSADAKKLVNVNTIPGQQVATAADPKTFNTTYPVPGLDLLISILSEGGLRRFNESGILERLADEPTSRVTCYGRRHKQWGSDFGDGITSGARDLTRAEIAAHPEWIGKYFSKEDRDTGFVDGSHAAGGPTLAPRAHRRDDVLWCEANYKATSDHGVRARGYITSLVEQSMTTLANGQKGSVWKINLALDANVDTTQGMVAALPVAPAGPYAQGMQGAMFATVDGAYPWYLHMVDHNDASAIYLYEAIPPAWINGVWYIRGDGVTIGSGVGSVTYVAIQDHISSTGVNDPVGHPAFWRAIPNYGLYLPAPGDHFELILFNAGLGVDAAGKATGKDTKRIEIGNLGLKLTRGCNMQFCAWNVHGFGQVASKVEQTTDDTPIYSCNGVAFFKFESWYFGASGSTSSRPLMDFDGTDFRTLGANNSNVALSCQQGKFVNMFWGGNFPNYSNRLGSPGAPVAFTDITSDTSQGKNTRISFVVPGGVTLKKNQLRNCLIVVAAAADGRHVGKKYLISYHEAANAGEKCTLHLYYGLPGFAPAPGDTFYVTVASADGVQFGAGKISTFGSTGPQGSEVTYLGCFAGGFSMSAVTTLTGNALQHTWLGGNIASCPCYGIFAFWGNWTVMGAGFQAGNDAVWNQINMARGDPSKYGFDMMFVNTNIDATEIVGCRSESARFLCNAGNPKGQLVTVRGCSCAGPFPNLAQWDSGRGSGVVALPTAGGTNLPSITQAANGAKRDGTFWVAQAINGGAKTSTFIGSEAEPDWLATGSPTGFGLRTVNENVVGGSGAGDVIAWYELDAWMYWLNGFLESGHLNVIEGDLIDVHNFSWNGLKMCPTGKRIGRIVVSRTDWISSGPVDWRNPRDLGPEYRMDLDGPVILNTIANTAVGIGGADGRWGWPPHNPGGGGTIFREYPLARRMGGVQPILWDVGDTGSDGIRWEGGWAPGARNTPVISPVGRRYNDTHYNNAVIAARSRMIVAPTLDLAATTGTDDQGGVGGLTDAAGNATQVGGGLGLGAGTPGPFDVMIGVKGSSGTTEQSYTRAARWDDQLRLNLLGAIAKMAVVGFVDITAGGSAIPNPNGAEIYRYRCAGNATISNPTAPLVEGQEFTLEILNNTGGAITVTLGTSFMGTFPAPGAGKWRTQAYVYDATLGKFKPKGAQTGDL